MNEPSQLLFDEIVRRIRQVVSPVRIVLFGSAARGEWRPGSDLDVLVVMPQGAHRRQTAQHLYREMIGVGCAIDIVVVTPDDVDRFRNSPATVIAPALQDGKVLYAA
jgi:predicted nucleotidyltransferase